MTAFAITSSGLTRTPAKSGEALSRLTNSIVRVALTSVNTLTCGAVNALDTIAFAIALRTPLTGIRSSRSDRPFRRLDVAEHAGLLRLADDVVAGDLAGETGRRDEAEVDPEVLGQLADGRLGDDRARGCRRAPMRGRAASCGLRRRSALVRERRDGVAWSHGRPWSRSRRAPPRTPRRTISRAGCADGHRDRVDHGCRASRPRPPAPGSRWCRRPNPPG